MKVKLRDPQLLAKVKLKTSASLESHTSSNSSHFLSPTNSTEFMFHGRGGLHQIEALCSAFHDLGCNEDAVEELKDTFLASITSSENPDEVCRSLATHLTRSIKEFCLSTDVDVEDESMDGIRDED